jgi:hypothetical protein
MESGVVARHSSLMIVYMREKKGKINKKNVKINFSGSGKV